MVTFLSYVSVCSKSNWYKQIVEFVIVNNNLNNYLLNLIPAYKNIYLFEEHQIKMHNSAQYQIVLIV